MAKPGIKCFASEPQLLAHARTGESWHTQDRDARRVSLPWGSAAQRKGVRCCEASESAARENSGSGEVLGESDFGPDQGIHHLADPGLTSDAQQAIRQVEFEPILPTEKRHHVRSGNL